MPSSPVRGLACGRSLRVVFSDCVGARWFEYIKRMSMTVVVRGGFERVRGRCLGAAGSQV